MKRTLIEIATAYGCSKCSKAKDLVSSLVGKRKDVLVREVNIAEQPELAIRHGIMTTPAIIINGELKFTNIPKREELENALKV